LRTDPEPVPRDPELRVYGGLRLHEWNRTTAGEMHRSVRHDRMRQPDPLVAGRQPQRQKQAFTQIRGAGSDDEQPHIAFGAVQSLAVLHSL
jgi:hypothetical protein